MENYQRIRRKELSLSNLVSFFFTGKNVKRTEKLQVSYKELFSSLNYLSANCSYDASSTLNSLQCVFSTNKNILPHSQSLTIKTMKLTLLPCNHQTPLRGRLLSQKGHIETRCDLTSANLTSLIFHHAPGTGGSCYSAVLQFLRCMLLFCLRYLHIQFPPPQTFLCWSQCNLPCLPSKTRHYLPQLLSAKLILLSFL